MIQPRRRTFRSPPYPINTQQRLVSPERPVIEPLSPPGNGRSTPFSRLFERDPQAPWQRARSSTKSNGPVKTGQHVRKASNTIDDLATIAVAVSGAAPYGASRQSQLHLVNGDSNRASQGQQSFIAPPYPYEVSTRLGKRARSDAEADSAFTSQFRGRDFCTEANTHKSQPKRLSESDSSSLADAALLLGFANSIPTRRSEPLRKVEPVPSSAREPPPAVAASEPIYPAPYVPLQPVLGHAHAEASPTRVRESFMQPPYHHPHALSNFPVRPNQASVATLQPLQTPSDVLYKFDTREEEEPSAITPELAEKPKTKRGWPKGKPRGSRKSTAKSTAAKPSSVRRARKTEASSFGELELKPEPPRRNSFAGIAPTYFELEELSSRAASVPPEFRYEPAKHKPGRKALPKFNKDTICEACKTARESTHGELDQWISCNGCQKWFHSDCAGFKNKADVRDVDKFFCINCESKHGPTTFVRKSNRAHAAVDYAGLNQGVLKTSDECNEHHYIQPIKDGTFTFLPETFPRMRPELVTADYFERSACFNEPVLIPAEFNPKYGKEQRRRASNDHYKPASDELTVAEDELLEDFEYETVPDDGQDKLDMVIPRDLTIRRVCELVGADYPLEVIDVKEQSTEGGKWNLGKWADYYESKGGDKAIRNVISLEVAHTKLGRLLRRPKLVRQIDLQDNVWPEDEAKKSVAFYCLMSVADSYTDFHIDFGGSSVYYHILRGSKTFLFIPPKPKHLKAYEDWNNSPTQNFTFLPDMTKECYRVDLSEGDTMLIPSGWIHAVWTPSNSLVIGGNFLTHMHYSMQFRVSNIEKANKVSAKFRYPKFQKVMWYAVLKYLSEDPLPDNVRQAFFAGQQFKREIPAWLEFDRPGPSSAKGTDSFNARYYSQMELDSLPELVSFIFRTVMISLDRIEGVTAESRKAVIASIPKSRGDPLENAKAFALWVAWKRGNEDPPAWAHPNACLPEKEGVESKKLSAKALRQMQRQEAFEATPPERQSARQKQKEKEEDRDVSSPTVQAKGEPTVVPPTYSAPTARTPEGPSPIMKIGACDACRKRRIRCKHKVEQPARSQKQLDVAQIQASTLNSRRTEGTSSFPTLLPTTPAVASGLNAMPGSIAVSDMSPPVSQTQMPHYPLHISAGAALENAIKRGRSKACPDCRKSKRRCVHDESGKIDPFKEKQLPVPRGTLPKKRKSSFSDAVDSKRPKGERRDDEQPGIDIDAARSSQTSPDRVAIVIPQAEEAAVVEPTDSERSERFAATLQAYADSAKVAQDDKGPSPVAFDTPLNSRQNSGEALAVAPNAITGQEMDTDPVLPTTEQEGKATHTEVKEEHIIDAHPSMTKPLSDGFADLPTSAHHDNSERTPSANDPPSLSSASSPLTTADDSPEPVATPVGTTFEAISRHSARQSKPVDRFVNQKFEPIKAPVEASPAAATAVRSGSITAAATTTPSKKRTASGSTHSSVAPSPNPRAASTASASSAKTAKTPKKQQQQLPGGGARPEATAAEVDGDVMDEDERFARQLASQSFGLRARRSVGA